MPYGPYHVTDTEHGPRVVIVTGVLMSYMILCYVARLLMRMTINGPLGTDDWVVAAGSLVATVQSGIKISESYHGLGRPMGNVDSENIREIEKLAFTGDIFYVIAMSLSKISMFLLFARLTRTTDHVRIAHVGSAIAATWGFASTFILCLRCDLSAPWTLVNPGCTQMYTRWYVVEAMGIVVEIIAACVPVYLIWNLQMHFKAKLVVLFAFSFRLPVIGFSAARIYFLRQEAARGDPIFYGADSSAFLEATMHYSLMAATIPCLRPFVKAFNTGYFDTHAEHNSPYETGYVLSSIRRSRYTATAHNGTLASSSNITKTARFAPDSRQPVRPSSDSRPSSSDGSDKMIIRRTTAFDVSVEYDDQAGPS